MIIISIHDEMMKNLENHHNYNKYHDGSDKEKEYLDYIMEHKSNVVKALENSQSNENFKNNYEELCNRVKNHDLSKLDDEEFESYRNYFYPNENEEKDKESFNKAWEHHYKNNSHHPEYFGKDEMSKIDILEMILDWEAMAYKFGGSAKEFYDTKKKKEIIDNEFNVDFDYLESSFFESISKEGGEEMSSEKFILSGDIQLSEIDNDKPYIELTTRLCYLDYPNLNGISLSSKANKESFDSLIDMPIVAKINNKGNKFGSHEVKRNKDGTISFSTLAYGVHTEVWVADDKVDIPDVGTKTVPCIFAKSKVWKRFESVCELIENKMKNPEKYNGGLFSSWELQGQEYNTDKGYKEYTKWTFLANTLIDVPPAYGKNSKTLEVAEKVLSFDEELSQAIERDIKLSEIDNENINNKEGVDTMEKDENIVVESEIKVEEIAQEEVEKSEEEASEEIKPEEVVESALNIRDLASKISKALNPNGGDGDSFYSMQEIYPEEKKVMCRDLYSESSDEVYVFSYTVSENEEVTLGEGVKRKISELIAEKLVSEKETLIKEKDIKISELESLLSTKDSEIEKLNNEISEKVETMVKVSEKITELETKVSELEPLKAEKELAEKLAREKELAEKKEALKVLATKGGYISSEELETSEEIKSMIENLDEKGIKAEIANRFISKLDEKQGLDKEVQVSEIQTQKIEQVKTDLNSEDDDKMLSAMDVVKKAFNIR